MDHDALDCITNLIIDDLVFKREEWVPKQIPAKQQLMIFCILWEKKESPIQLSGVCSTSARVSVSYFKNVL